MRAIARHLSAWEEKNGLVDFGRHKSRAAWWDVLHAEYADGELGLLSFTTKLIRIYY